MTREAGLSAFRNIQGSPAKQHIVEVMGGGAGFLDYDRDGNLDILLVRGSTIEQFSRGGDRVCALYQGTGRGQFRMSQQQAGLTARGWGMGVAVGDIDNDGWDDIYIAGYRKNFLFRNRGDGTFEEIGVARGVAGGRWSVAAAFADLDRDGDLDLYVANYLEYPLDRIPKRDASCNYRGFAVFCGPRGLTGERDYLYWNDGKGHFRDVSAEKGIDVESFYRYGSRHWRLRQRSLAGHFRCE